MKMKSTAAITLASIGLAAGLASAHDGVAGDHLSIGYYFGHDGTFEAPAVPAQPATLLVDTHPWELGEVFYNLTPVDSFLLDGWQSTLPGFEPLGADDEEFGGHGFYSWKSDSWTGEAPQVRLQVVEKSEGIQIIAPDTFEPQPDVLPLPDEFHLHAIFYVDRATAGEPGTIYSVTYRLTDTTGQLADSEEFTLQFAIACNEADIDADGDNDVFDALDFIDAYDPDLPSQAADIDNDGDNDVFDALDFITAYGSDC